ncbi:MAG: prenyltransferase/squalene oxidase repeat-containing protein [Verrucomicrobiota bacterium]|nr:prenyltransferase/squalene oxidase repeat-containing protein [Verrucomicrobiota bacterium]
MKKLLVLSIFCTVISLKAAAPVDAPVLQRNESLRHELNRSAERAKKWLLAQQQTNGAWSTPDHPAVTGLAMAAISRFKEAEDAAALDRGLGYLKSCVQTNGAIFKKSELINYNTSVSLLGFLAHKPTEHREIIQRANNFLVGSQISPDNKAGAVFVGGVGYGSKYSHSDMGNTLHALEAIHYAQTFLRREGASDFDQLNVAAAIEFLQNCQNLPSHNKQAWVSGDPQNIGGFIYYPGHSMAGSTNLSSGRTALRSYGSVSYAGLLSYIYTDLKAEDPRVKAVIEWLEKNYTLEENPGMEQQGLYYYFHTMAKALTAAGMETIQTPAGSVKWREQLLSRLMNLQQADGSWVNTNARWWEKDPVLVTSYMLIALSQISEGI